jgi:hypothetical protein
LVPVAYKPLGVIRAIEKANGTACKEAIMEFRNALHSAK